MNTDIAQEIASQHADTQRVAAYFEAHPLRELEQADIAVATGVCESSLRTRISNCKLKLKMRIVPVRTSITLADGTHKRLKNRYLYTPYSPLGRSADQPSVQPSLLG